LDEQTPHGLGCAITHLQTSREELQEELLLFVRRDRKRLTKPERRQAAGGVFVAVVESLEIPPLSFRSD
jgi:hypothetical protein